VDTLNKRSPTDVPASIRLLAQGSNQGATPSAYKYSNTRPKEHQMFNGYTESQAQIEMTKLAIEQGKTRRQLILELRDEAIKLEAVTEFAVKMYLPKEEVVS
jgi:hypothetical protein